MKDQDIKLPSLRTIPITKESDVWKAILDWYKAKVEDSSLVADVASEDVEYEIRKLLAQYAREAVLMNQQIDTSEQLIPFDLEAAKRGESLVTRDGRKARFLAHEPDLQEASRIICVVEGCVRPVEYYENGARFIDINEIPLDLFMAPKPKRVVYLNVYSSGAAVVHQSKAEAIKSLGEGAEYVALPIELP